MITGKSATIQLGLEVVGKSHEAAGNQSSCFSTFNWVGSENTLFNSGAQFLVPQVITFGDAGV